MIVSINQPAYLPWVGYFHRIALSDRHIVLNHVQFEKNSLTNRNKIRTGDGWTWLTAPVETKGKFGNLPINELALAGGVNWRQKHWRSLCQNYSKAPYFDRYAPELEKIYEIPWTSLDALCTRMTDYFLEELEIETKILYSADMKPQGNKDALVLDLCKKSGATVYLSGSLGRDYLREPPFGEAGIKVIYQDYKTHAYPQHRKGAFEPYMGIVDLLFNLGPNSFGELMKGQPE